MNGPAPVMLALLAGESTAIVHPDVGGRLGQLDLGSGPLLRGPAPNIGPFEWGCYPLLPWSNRLPGATLRFGDIAASLPANHDDGSAIHGLAATCPWSVIDHSERRAVLRVDVQGGPYRVRGVQTYALTDGRLDLHLAATNHGDLDVPMGIGIHPWFRSGPIRVPAAQRWPGEPIPTGQPVDVTGHHDLRAGTVPAPMDACFTALSQRWADVPGTRLRWDGPITHVVVYSGVSGWVCVEPVTMANNGIAMADAGIDGHGVQVLPPGASIEVTYSFERRPPE